MKTYINYIILNFIKKVFLVSLIFFLLILLLNLFEEINYFKDIDQILYYPLLLNILNAPSVLNSLFPFFLIATQFLILSLIENNELIILKNFG